MVTSKKGNGPTIEYTYDHTGAKVKKKNTQTGNITYYINQYYEIQNNQPIRHIYAGNQKIANKKKDGPIVFHLTDHLSGTSIDIDQTNSIVLATDYYPFSSARTNESDENTRTAANSLGNISGRIWFDIAVSLLYDYRTIGLFFYERHTDSPHLLLYQAQRRNLKLQKRFGTPKSTQIVYFFVISLSNFF